MRVLQITAFSGWGCTGRIALGINNALIKEGHESVIAWGRINTAPTDVKTIQIGNHLDQQFHGLYTRLTDKCGFGSKRTTLKFIREIESYNPDIIQLHIMHGYYINLEILFDYIKEKNIPVVWTFHDCWAFTGHCPYFDLVNCEKWKTGCYDCPQKKHHPSSWLLDNSKWNWNKKKEIYGNYKELTVVAPSRWMAELVNQSFLKGNEVIVINNGINTKNFHPVINNIKSSLGITDKKIILGVSSSWAASKGLNDFIALSKILDKEYQIVLVGLPKQEINNLPSNIIGIERTDNVQELAMLYTAASLFVNPTYEDNYPTTNLEALACGTPIITYRTGGSVEAAGMEYGYIVNQGDVMSIKSIIDSESWKEKKEKLSKIDLSYLDETIKFNQYVSLYQCIYNKQTKHN